MDEMERITLVVPAKFWWDHDARDCVNHGSTAEVAGKGKVRVHLHPFDLADLYSDADHYADPYTAREMGEPGLASSARATMRAIEKVVDAETLKGYSEAWAAWEGAQR